ncbi:MAG: hypothetical protein AAF614_16935 [Chloroflexota bacterium]
MLSTNTLRQRWPLFLFSLAMFIAYGGLVQLDWRFGTLRDGVVPQTIGWYGFAWIAWLAAIVWVERGGEMPKRWLWGTAVLCRLLLLFTTPTLSDDVYRYLWDGYVANQGVSPYAHAIESPELDYLDHPVRALANNQWMASPYLPAAQYLFFGLTFVLPIQPIFMQIAMIISDLLAAWILSKLLRLVGLPAHRILLYLWNPLIIVEVAHGAHLDAWMVLLLITAVYLTLKPLSQTQPVTRVAALQPFGAPLFLALATLTKILPVLALPVLFWRWTWRQIFFYGGIVLLLLLPAGIRGGWGLTGELDGTGLFGAVRIYESFWNFNSGLFHWLEVRWGAPGYGTPLDEAKIVILAAMFLLMLFVWWLGYQRREDDRALLRLLALPFPGHILLATTIHPWYAHALLTFIIFLAPAKAESKGRWLAVVPWLYLSGALVLSYMTYIDPLNFGELAWVRQAEWMPTLLLVVLFLFAVPYLYWPKRIQ